MKSKLSMTNTNDNTTPLKTAMESIGMTVGDLSQITGISTRMIEYYRSGKYSSPRWLELFMIGLKTNKIDMNWVIDITKNT